MKVIIDFFKGIFGQSGSGSSQVTAEKTVEKPRRQRQRPENRQRPKRDGEKHKGGREKQRQRDRERPPKKAWSLDQFPVEPEEGKTRFHDLDLPLSLMHAIADLDFKFCTPIQAETLPGTLAGKDITGRAQTGTGKTAAFLITILAKVIRNPIKKKRANGTPRALIIAPTRELVIQIAKDCRELSKYAHVRTITIFGGMDYRKQKEKLSKQRIDIMVATPGRLLDFVSQKIINLREVEVMVIDEADRMLDMGFIPAVRKIIRSTPPKEKRQTLLFSATLTPEVTDLASRWTRDAVSVEIEPEQVAVDSVEQIVYIVTYEDKKALLLNLLSKKDVQRAIVFANRRDDTWALAELFDKYGIDCEVLSGDVPQKKRLRTLDSFKAGKIRLLVATDVAGRGIHVDGLDHVINYTLPYDPEDYVHRIGRTGRAGKTGTSISFASEEDAFQIPAIEEFLGQKLPCTTPEDEWLEMPEAPERKPGEIRERRRPQRGRSGSGGGQRGRSGSRNGGGRRRNSGDRQRNDNNKNQNRQRNSGKKKSHKPRKEEGDPSNAG